MCIGDETHRHIKVHMWLVLWNMQGSIVSIGEWGSIMSIKEPWQMLGNASEVNYGGKASWAYYFFNAHVLFILMYLHWENFLLRACLLAHHIYWSLFWKTGETFGDSFFHLSNFEKILRPKIRHVHEIRCPKFWSTYARLALPTHPP